MRGNEYLGQWFSTRDNFPHLPPGPGDIHSVWRCFGAVTAWRERATGISWTEAVIAAKNPTVPRTVSTTTSKISHSDWQVLRSRSLQSGDKLAHPSPI